MFLDEPTIGRHCEESEESTSRTLDEDEASSDESDRVVRRLVRHVRFFFKCEESDESTSRRLDKHRASSDESDRAGATRPTFVIKSYESDFVGATPRLVCLTSQRRPDATPRNDESLPRARQVGATRPTSGTSTV